MKSVLIILFLTCFFPSAAWSADAPSKGSDKGKKTPSRTKSMDFDEAVVEGVNKNPYDAFQHVGNQDQAQGPARLYRRKPHFRKENSRVLMDLKFTP